MLSCSRTCTKAFYFLLQSTYELHIIRSNVENILSTRSFVSNETKLSNTLLCFDSFGPMPKTYFQQSDDDSYFAATLDSLAELEDFVP